MALFSGQILKHGAAPLIPRQGGGPVVELQPASLGRDRHPQGVAREHELGGGAIYRGRSPAGPAVLADAVDLEHRPRSREAAIGRDLLHQCFDV
jgi:hypothetical protein